MNDYRIKMCQGKLCKHDLGKYYVQFRKPNKKRWKNYKDNDWPDDWKSTVYYDTEEEAMEQVSKMIKDNIDSDRKRAESKEYVREIGADRIAKLLLEDG